MKSQYGQTGTKSASGNISVFSNSGRPFPHVRDNFAFPKPSVDVSFTDPTAHGDSDYGSSDRHDLDLSVVTKGHNSQEPKVVDPGSLSTPRSRGERSPTSNPADDQNAAALHGSLPSVRRSRCRLVCTKAKFEVFKTNAAARHSQWAQLRTSTIASALRGVGLDLSDTDFPLFRDEGGRQHFLLNLPLKFVLSEFVRRTRMPLRQFVELIRVQTADDYRPNKDIVPDVLARLCDDYKHRELLLQIAAEGVRISTSKTPPLQASPPRNHGSASERTNVLRKNIRKDQDEFRCVVLDLDLLSLWSEIRVSPFGIVDKTGTDPELSGRTIHDLSFPEGSSINGCTDQQSIERPEFAHCHKISEEVLRLKDTPALDDAEDEEDVYLVGGDVSSAFRNVSIHSSSVHLVCGAIEEEHALIVELSAPFGWTGSPGFYEVYGGAISHIHGHTMTESVPDGFFNYHWVDDHINVARMVDPQLQDAERSLRFAMISVFGSPAINEDKFTGWHMQLKVLGLLFDTVACTVAMPAVKIQKASQLVLAAYHSETMSQKAYRSLLGSLRHVATCIRSARPFLQRLRVQELGLQHRFGKVTVSEPMRHDLVWWWKILQSPDLNGVPMRFFHALPSRDVVVEMNASDHGLCALDMTYKCLFTYEYSVHERVLISEFKSRHDNEFDINFRELLSAAFAVFLWGPRWSNIQSDTQVHVHFRIDNTSAVSWQTKMGSRNARAQVLLRLLGYWENSYGLRFSSSHIAGVDNVVAGFGSRLAGPAAQPNRFELLTSGWSRDYIQGDHTIFSTIWRAISALTPLPHPPTPNI